MMLPVGLLSVLVAAAVGRRIGGTIGRLLPFGAAARVVGGVARHQVNEVFYNGSGDSKRYFAYGATHASDVWSLDFGFLVADDARWWGTRFIENLSAFVIALVGENILSGFVVFAMFSLAGVTLLALAFRSVRGEKEERLFASLLLLWPSLWFWPSSMGKDAVMLLGVGLTVFGYVGRGERVAVGALVAGFTILTCIRPHVAAIVAGGMVAAELLRARAGGKMSWFRRLSLVSIGVAGGATALSQFGLDITDVEGIEETFDRYSGQTSTGGSMIGSSSGGTAVAMALVNSLMRPFPWEAHHIFALFASIEVWALWTYLWARRRTFGPVLRRWRSDRLLRVGVPVGLLLAFFYGLAMSNLGIIARQRVVILPFLFMLIAVSPSRRKEPDEAAL